MNGFIIDKLKGIKQLQNSVKLDDLKYATKRGKYNGFSKYSLPIVFLRDKHKGSLSVEDAVEHQMKKFFSR